MTFAEYYTQHFRGDIQRFIAAIPAERRHHDGSTLTRDFTIQRNMLTKLTPCLDAVPSDRLVHFSVALFFTVLVDEVAYTHFRPHYAAFQALTVYPKLMGNCFGMCHVHLHPKEIFRAMHDRLNDGGEDGGEDGIGPRVMALLPEAVQVMRREVFDFFQRHQQAVDPAEFWQRCEAEFPWRQALPQAPQDPHP